jgi:hypothetical protein
VLQFVKKSDPPNVHVQFPDEDKQGTKHPKTPTRRLASRWRHPSNIALGDWEVFRIGLPYFPERYYQ